MKRREFITLLSGAAVVWPGGAWAQRPDRMRRIGVLMHLAADDAEGQRRIGFFCKVCKRQVGQSAATSTSTCDGQRARPIAFVDMRWN
jgi:hypothetical protein